MTANQQTILAVMNLNIENAKTRGMREFATTQRDEFKARIQAAERKAVIRPPRAFESFLENLSR